MRHKHTPGPWKAVHDTIYRASVVGHELLHPIATIRLKKRARAVTGEARANAQLISACPELLESLLEMVEVHQRGLPHPMASCAYCQKANAAIAKARGDF